LAIPAVVAMAVRRHRHAVTVLVPLAVGWLTATFAALTMHGWWWPGRQIVVVLPAVVLAVVWWANERSVTRVVLLALGVLGVVTYGWLAVEGARHTLAWVVDFTSTSNPLYRMWRPLLPNGRTTAAGALIRQGVWTVIALAAAGVTRWADSPMARN